MENEIKQISVDLIDDPFKPMRTEITSQSIEELAADIKKHGLIQPITVRPKGERYEVVAGHRRFKATKLAELATINSVVVDLEDEEADAVKVRENLYREDINPVDEAEHIGYLIERYQYEPKQLADMLGKSQDYLRDRYAILEYPDYLKEALRRGDIGITAAQWLIKITDENIRRDYVRFAILGGITARRAEAWYKSWSAGQLPRDPDSYVAPAPAERSEPEPIKEKCVLCRVEDDINEMQMYYAHGTCAEAAASAHA